MRLKAFYFSIFLVCAMLAVWWAGAPAEAAQGALDVIFKESEAEGAKDGPKARLYSASKALVIGLDNYTEKAWPKLSGAIKDAEAVARTLESKGFSVTFATDLRSEELDRAFRDFFINEGSDPEARLLVWFAGHGHTIGGEGYLVPIDGADPRTSDLDFRRKALSLRRFGEYMREARAKHVLAVFDSCFAGTVFNVARALPPRAITLSTALPVRQFISSGDADQVVSDNGSFRRLFVDAIEGREPGADANRDGFVTGSELGNFLFDKVTNYSEKGQTPRYGKLNAQGFDRGDFVFEQGKLAIPPLSSGTAAQETGVSAAARLWEREVRSSQSVDVLEAFIKLYPDTVYAALARERLAKSRRDAEAAKMKLEANLTKPPPQPQPLPPPEVAAAEQLPAVTKSVVRDAKAKAKLLGKRKLALQWISWEYFGTLNATESNGLIRLKGEQKSRANDDFLRIDGVVKTIDTKEFTFVGTITQKVYHLDDGKPCTRRGEMTFAITQNRKYWRLQSMNDCGVTDYVDIFF